MIAETTFRQTDEFEYNRAASEQVGSWFDTQYSNITSSKFEGWWYIENTFYDLQLGLFEGTKASLGKCSAIHKFCALNKLQISGEGFSHWPKNGSLFPDIFLDFQFSSEPVLDQGRI